MKYKVKRAFYLNKSIQVEGSIIELTDREMIGGLKSFGKIEPVEIEQPVGKMTTESVGGLIAGKKAKE